MEATKTKTFTVYTLDVWGNADDGWDVNDRSKAGTIDLDPDAPDAEILRALMDAGFVNGDALKFGTLEGDDGMIFLDDSRDGCPVLHLEAK